MATAFDEWSTIVGTPAGRSLVSLPHGRARWEETKVTRDAPKALTPLSVGQQTNRFHSAFRCRPKQARLVLAGAFHNGKGACAARDYPSEPEAKQPKVRRAGEETGAYLAHKLLHTIFCP